ncbi:ABC transporter permease [Streptomyces sp. TRM43335]|uniref:ABC transporter permease n=1 Tax=Streptomyces taklimakanensis TaxID=2569853 RepID=A0A6G2BGS4_9ACTN|nr:ABC transporter permease [Streptomyces taklimakanensis]MTE21404.1 ABC transporter permease [Streptomyces taklimakanensis]
MNETLRAALATHRRNTRLLRRRPDLVAQGVLVPLVVMVLSAVLFGAWGDSWPVGMVDRAKTEQSARVLDAFEESSSNVEPYFRTIETDPEKAESMIRDGRLQLLVEIPEDFDTTGRVEITTYNINTDATKNLRLRVEDALNIHDQRSGAMTVAADLRTVQPQDVTRSAYIAGSLTLLALLLGAVLLAANLFAMEHEGRTGKELLMSPRGAGAAAQGTVLTATAVAYLSALPTFLTGLLLFGFRPDPAALGLVALFMLPVLVAAAGLGVLLAQVLREHRAVQPPIILTAIATFFVCGGFVGVDGMPPVARAISEWWPASRIFEWANPVLHRFSDSFPAGQWVWAVVAALLGVLAAAWAGRREQAAPRNNGQ